MSAATHSVCGGKKMVYLSWSCKLCSESIKDSRYQRSLPKSMMATTALNDFIAPASMGLSKVQLILNEQVCTCVHAKCLNKLGKAEESTGYSRRVNCYFPWLPSLSLGDFKARYNLCCEKEKFSPLWCAYWQTLMCLLAVVPLKDAHQQESHWSCWHRLLCFKEPPIIVGMQENHFALPHPSLQASLQVIIVSAIFFLYTGCSYDAVVAGNARFVFCRSRPLGSRKMYSVKSLREQPCI